MELIEERQQNCVEILRASPTTETSADDLPDGQISLHPASFGRMTGGQIRCA
jgi:hypothetical protein